MTAVLSVTESTLVATLVRLIENGLTWLAQRFSQLARPGSSAAEFLWKPPGRDSNSVPSENFG